MTNKEIYTYMDKLKEEVNDVKESILKEVHKLDIRLTSLESFSRGVLWVMGGSGFLAIISGIIYIFKALTN